MSERRTPPIQMTGKPKMSGFSGNSMIQHQKYFTKKLLPAAICAASIQAIAADYNVGTAITTPVELTADYDTVSISADGSISGIASQDSALILDARFGSVTNAGQLHGGQGGDGITLVGTITGDLVNNGRIDAVPSEEGNSAIRLLEGSRIEGRLINGADGVLASGGDDGSATIEVQEGAVAGDIINRGTITHFTGPYSVGDAIGIYGTVRSIENSGTITSEDSGIQMHGSVEKSIVNKGTISVSGGEAWGDAIGVGGHVGGEIRNEGQLLLSADSCEDDPFCLAGGIGLYGGATVDGGIVNTGTISTTVNGLANALGAGINLMSVQDATGASLGSPTVGGDIVNAGSISGDFTAIFLGGATVNGDIVNTETGTLSGAHGMVISDIAAETGPIGPLEELSPGDEIETYHLGMVDGGASPAVIDGSIINHGTITGLHSDGITIEGDVTIRGDIVNTGTIATLGSQGYGAIWFGADGDTGEAGATLTGAIINAGQLRSPTETEGTITINGAHQVGGVINIAGGVIENTAAGDDKYAIWVDDAGSLGYVINAGTIRGAVDFGAKGGVFDAAGGTNDAVHNARRINIRSTGEVGPTVSTFTDGLTYSGTIGVDALGSASGLAHGQLQVLGDADVRGASVDVMVSGEQFIENGASFTFLQADGSLQSDIATATDNSAVLSFDIAQSGNALTATARRTAFGEVIATGSDAIAGAAGANTLQVAGALDSVVAAVGDRTVDENSELGSVINHLSALGTVDEVAAAVRSLQPEVAGKTVAAASAAGNAAAGTISNRQASLRGYGQTGMVAGDTVAVNGFWMQLYHSSGDQDTRKGIHGYDLDTTGLALGADAPVGEHVDLGFALAYGQTDVDSDRDSTIDVDSYQLSLYASYNPGRWFADGIVSYARNQYETERTLFTGAVAKADYDGDQYDVRARAGYPFAIDERLQLTPMISAQYTHLDEEKYRERGVGNAGLIIDSDTNEAFVVGASLEAAYTFTSASQTHWIPSITLGVFKDVIGDEVELQSGFIGLPSASFSTRGADVATTSYLAGIGLQVSGQSDLSVTLSYDYLSRDDYRGQSASATLRYAF